MKSIHLTVLLLLLGLFILAQPPQAFKYHTVERNSTSELISSQTIGVRNSIHNATLEWNNYYSAIIIYGDPNKGVFWEILANQLMKKMVEENHSVKGVNCLTRKPRVIQKLQEGIMK